MGTNEFGMMELAIAVAVIISMFLFVARLDYIQLACY